MVIFERRWRVRDLVILPNEIQEIQKKSANLNFHFIKITFKRLQKSFKLKLSV
jgi:hypothetical protein